MDGNVYDHWQIIPPRMKGALKKKILCVYLRVFAMPYRWSSCESSDYEEQSHADIAVSVITAWPV